MDWSPDNCLRCKRLLCFNIEFGDVDRGVGGELFVFRETVRRGWPPCIYAIPFTFCCKLLRGWIDLYTEDVSQEEGDSGIRWELALPPASIRALSQALRDLKACVFLALMGHRRIATGVLRSVLEKYLVALWFYARQVKLFIEHREPPEKVLKEFIDDVLLYFGGAEEEEEEGKERREEYVVPDSEIRFVKRWLSDKKKAPHIKGGYLSGSFILLWLKAFGNWLAKERKYQIRLQDLLGEDADVIPSYTVVEKELCGSLKKQLDRYVHAAKESYESFSERCPLCFAAVYYDEDELKSFTKYYQDILFFIFTLLYKTLRLANPECRNQLLKEVREALEGFKKVLEEASQETGIRIDERILSRRLRHLIYTGIVRI